MFSCSSVLMCMTIPLYFFLIPYLLFVGIIFIFLLINFGHLKNTGTLTPGSSLVTMIVFFLIGTVLLFTFIALREVTWTQPISIWNSSWTPSFNPSAP